jgi:hypothetical protein
MIESISARARKTSIHQVLKLKRLTIGAQPAAVMIVSQRPEYNLLLQCDPQDDTHDHSTLTDAQTVATYLMSRRFALTVK